MTKKIKRLAMVALAIVMAFTLTLGMTGCGGGTSTSGNYLRVGWCSEPDIMNPLTSYSTESKQITGLVYETLMTYDADMNEIPALAKSYDYSNGNKTVTFHLVDNATWHDGEPFTADDVVCTYKIIKDYGISECVQYVDPLTDIKAIDDYTVEMTFSEPQAYSPAFVVPILPKHIWGEMDAAEIEAFANETPIGTGPYKFTSWEEGSTAQIDRNEEYHGEAPGPDGVIYILYGNEDVAVQALAAGEVDILTEVSATLFETLKDQENIVAADLPSYSFHYLGFNMSTKDSSKGNKMVLDLPVRQALAHCINKDKMVELCLSGYGEPGTSVLPPGFADWKYDFSDDEIIGYDLDEAKSILDNAGYTDSDGDGIRDKDGEPMSFRLFCDEAYSADVRAAELFKDECKKIGVEITLSTYDENTLGDIVYDTEATDFDITIWGWDADYPDPSYMLGITLTSQIGNNNEVYYSNPEYDALYDQQAQLIDKGERKAVINEMEKMLYNDCAFNMLWYQNKLQAYRTDRFEGWQDAAGGMIFSPTYVNYTNIQPIQQ